MRRARDRVARWPIREDGWQALRPGLRRIYRRGRADWRAAAANPSAARLHEWRKRSKDVRYVLELLECVWPKVMHAFAGSVDALTDRLGEDHDLALLRRFALDVCGNGGNLKTLLAVIDGSRRELQVASWTLAARIYAERPRRFSRRHAIYWRASRAEAVAEDENATAVAPSDARELASA